MIILHVKYALLPVYEKVKLRSKECPNEHAKLLFGYVTSKCYKIDNNTVFFPYVIDNVSYCLDNRRDPRDIKIGYNTNFVDRTFDSYYLASSACDIKNHEHLCDDQLRYYSLEKLEELITANTNDMKINDISCIKLKKRRR